MPLPFVEQIDIEFFPVIAGRRGKPFSTNEAAWRWIDNHTDLGRADQDWCNKIRSTFSEVQRITAAGRFPASQQKAKTMSEEMMSEEMIDNLPAISTDDGFGEGDFDDRLIKGTLLKCVDGVWSARDDSDVPSALIALSTTQALQRWDDGKPVETILKQPGRPLPDADELNAKISKKSWEKGLDGQPRPPWGRQHIVYMLNPGDGGLFTYANGTAGARIATRKLKEKVFMMRAVRGAHIVPVIKLSCKAMRTQFGVKQRPFFNITNWRNLSGEPQIATATAAPMLEVGATVKPVGIKEELNDDLPW